MGALTWVRGVNGTLGYVAPRTVANKMRRVFMTPRELPPRDWELPLLAQAQRVTLRFGLSALRWGEGPAVLLMHGWEGRPTQFASLINALVDNGYSVIALDGPAHGHSPGREAHVLLFARAMLEAAAELPPLHAVIGHSMGGASAMLAVQLGLRTNALVSIAAPSRFLDVLRGFTRMVGLPTRARLAFIQEVELTFGMPLKHLDVAHYDMAIPGLIVHAEDDTFVPVKAAKAIHEAWFDSRLLQLEQGGHQKVLADPRVIDGVLTLLAGARLQERQSA
ncbi:alpha/beta hydrolase [Pseudomonas rhodesiae]|jgi:pimeloyl-ACP methyl ester carboxylesterase|uniref:alpha/beta hydrolase n=1 Tax=Pseudomonas rhodesiae TaxID=76760 RepID=UPI0024DF636B|nr:alpha/beta fold hydrolase [Pseudomonas rhodesiae]WHT77708.1 Putative aminoacrylate hydrolase RutD [Pseudomonas rhodesiae]